MKIRFFHPALSAVPLILNWTAPAHAQQALPSAIGEWKAIGPVKMYDTQTVFDYMDGGAEVYLSYGLKSLAVQVYEKPGEPSITLNFFTMEQPAGAFGEFTYERMDEDAGLGQGSEYGSGMLRFWQGNTFVFIQAMQETPAVKETIFKLAKSLPLAPVAAVPALAAALPKEGLRPLTVRYVLGRQLLESMESAALNNALGLPVRCEAVMGRYGKPGKGERVFVIRYPDVASANRGISNFLKGSKIAVPVFSNGAWLIAEVHGNNGILVLDAASAELATKRLEETRTQLKEVVK